MTASATSTTSSINTAMGAREWLMLITLSVLWGGSFFFVGVFGRRFKGMGLSPVVIAAGQVTGSSLVLAPVALYIDGLPTLLGVDAPSFGTWAAILTLAVFSTALAYVLYFKILASAGATNIMLVTLLVPVSAILLGSLFLNEVLEWVHFVGMALIAFGLAVIDGRLISKLKYIKG